MKKYYTILCLALASLTQMHAQAPQGFNYQATVRDGSGELIVNTNVYFKFNIIQGSQTALPIFTETHYVPTDDLGQVNLVIGQGTANTGTFSELDWSLGSYYLGIELDIGDGYVAMGTTQLLSVPYALYSETSGNASPITSVIPDGTNDGDILKWDSEDQSWKAFENDIFLSDLEIISYEPNVFSTYVDVGGQIISDGGNSIISKGVVWSLTPNPTIENDNKIVYGSGYGNFSVRIDDLTPLTSYHYRSYVTSTAGTAYGQVYTFTTLDILPDISTTPVSNITVNSAISGVIIDENLGTEIINSGIIWQPNHNDNFTYDNNVSSKEGLSNNLTMTNLERGTLYYVKSYAQNNLGYSYGQELSFETLSELASVLTFNPTSSSGWIQAGGLISDNGGTTIENKGVIIGLEEDLSIDNNLSIYYDCSNNDCNNNEFQTTFEGIINPNTLYYVRAFASNVNGTSYGESISVLTGPGAPSLTTINEDKLTERSYVINGVIDSNGGSEITEYGFLYSRIDNNLSFSNGQGTIDSNIVGSQNFLGEFSLTLDQLIPNSTYYFRSYAKNDIGTSYGEIKNFNTDDIDYFDIISPNINSVWTPGQTYNIIWETNFSGRVFIDFYQNNEYSLEISNSVNSNPTSTTYEWAMSTQTQYSLENKIIITSFDTAEILSESETFSLNKIFSLTSPTVGDVITDDNITLSWETNYITTLKIELYKGSQFIKLLSDSIDSSNGEFSINLSNDNLVAGDNYRFKISDSSNNEFLLFSELFQVESKFGQFTDSRDGNVYSTVVIGNQTWMTEDLKYEGGNFKITYDGSVTYRLSGGEWQNTDCDWYNYPTGPSGYENRCWGIATTQPEYVPDGWRIPTEEDWRELESFLGMDESDLFRTDTYLYPGIEYRLSGEVGKKLKSTEWNGDDDFGFNLLPRRSWENNTNYTIYLTNESTLANNGNSQVLRFFDDSDGNVRTLTYANGESYRITNYTPGITNDGNTNFFYHVRLIRDD